ncbi:dihydrofolate reductase family protein [Amycolatopsis silviterrae]|uniref:Dihydrofolate reductase family protein n=1 Tax=Amycolatopsis silviterrae TaxID=1656914 RepID=A0ABW5HHK8_9PSEU
MRKLVLKMSMSLDGFVCGPDGEAEWMLRSRGEDSAAWLVENLQQAGVHVVGGRTYHAMARHWPTSPEPVAVPMNDIPKVVFTRQKPADADLSSYAESWASARFAHGDLADEIQRLKEQPGKDIFAHGGAGFARSLVRLGLVDEYRLVVHPVAIGAGKALFGDLPKPVNLDLVSTTAFAAGTMVQVYRPAAG